MKLYSQTATFIEEAERIKKSAEGKEGYGKLNNLSTEIWDKDLIAAGFTCYSKQWRNWGETCPI